MSWYFTRKWTYIQLRWIVRRCDIKLGYWIKVSDLYFSAYLVRLAFYLSPEIEKRCRWYP